MHTIVAVPLDDELATFIGKKGSANSITFYNRSYKCSTIVALVPSDLGSKFYALPESLLIAKDVVLSTKNIDKTFGEVIVACQLLGKRLLLTEDNDASQVTSFYPKGLIETVDRETLLDKILEDNRSVQESGKSEAGNSGTRIDIDRSFNVKGVGTVVLGVVRKGIVKRHDTLFAPNGKEVVARSLQAQDQDMESAEEYVRIGIALKGAEADEIEKGDTLTSYRLAKRDRIKARLVKSNFVGESMLGSRYGLASSFSYTTAIIEALDGDLATLALEKPIAIENKDRFLLVREKAPRIFAAGTVED